MSVLRHLSQLGCQIDSNVFIQGVVCDVCKVVQVVEAVHPLPLLGLPQQRIPVDAENRAGSEQGSGLLPTEDGAGQNTGGDITRNTSSFMPGVLLRHYLMHLSLKQMKKPRLMPFNDLPEVTEKGSGWEDTTVTSDGKVESVFSALLTP